MSESIKDALSAGKDTYSSSLLPGSIDEKTTKPEMFPFEAFEFTAASSATPTLTLKSGWLFEVTGNLDVGGDVAITGNTTITGNAAITGVVTISEAGSDFYNPGNGVSCGTLKWLASPYYSIRSNYDIPNSNVITESVISSGAIPTGVKVVKVYYHLYSTSLDIFYFLDSDGEILMWVKPVVNNAVGGQCDLPVDGSGNIYWQGDADHSQLDIKILGYWI